MLTPKPGADIWRRLSVAVSVSVGLHALLLALLFWHRPPALLGGTSAVDGRRADTGRIYLRLALRARPAPESNILEKTPAALSHQVVATKMQDGKSHPALPQGPGGASLSPASIPEEANGTLSASQPATRATNDVTAAGDADGDQTLLQQIARCFPVGATPSLPTVRLEIQVDGEGNLAAMPVTDIDLGKSSPDDIRAANTIIQATLLCGPYVLPPAAQGRVSVLANFSKTSPGTQATAIPASSSSSF